MVGVGAQRSLTPVCMWKMAQADLLQVLRLGLPDLETQPRCLIPRQKFLALPLDLCRRVYCERAFGTDSVGSCSGWGWGGIWPWSGHYGLGWDWLTFVGLGSLESGEITLESPWEMEQGLKDEKPVPGGGGVQAAKKVSKGLGILPPPTPLPMRIQISIMIFASKQSSLLMN